MATPEDQRVLPERCDRCPAPDGTALIEGLASFDRAPVAADALDATKDLHIESGFDSIAERRRVFDWLGAGLRPDRPGRLQQEYPLLFKHDASVFHLTLYQGSTPIAFCTLWAVHFRVGVDRLRAGLISSVYTDPSARGRGHAGRVVNRALEKARDLNLGLALLWSDIDSLYTRLGFVQAGGESLLLVDQETLRSAIVMAGETTGDEAFAIERPGIEDWRAIERLRGDRDCQLELDAGELSTMHSIPDMSVRVARRRGGNGSKSHDEIVAFAIRGKGDDFGEVIHEWAGEPEATLQCCQSLIEECDPHNQLFLLAPPDATEAPWHLRKAGARVIRQPLAWMRVASATALAEDLSRIVPDSTRIRIREAHPAHSAEGRAPDLIIETTKGSLTLDPATFLELILGPELKWTPCASTARLETPHGPGLAPVLDDRALEALPLAFFVWGMESI